MAKEDEQHEQHATACMEAGYDLLLEKPIADIKGKEYKILFTKKDWISEEILGIPNDGYIVGEKLNEQCKFTFKYHGNKIVGVMPNKNVTIAFEEGL